MCTTQLQNPITNAYCHSKSQDIISRCVFRKTFKLLWISGTASYKTLGNLMYQYLNQTATYCFYTWRNSYIPNTKIRNWNFDTLPFNFTYEWSKLLLHEQKIITTLCSLRPRLKPTGSPSSILNSPHMRNIRHILKIFLCLHVSTCKFKDAERSVLCLFFVYVIHIFVGTLLPRGVFRTLSNIIMELWAKIVNDLKPVSGFFFGGGEGSGGLKKITLSLRFFPPIFHFLNFSFIQF